MRDERTTQVLQRIYSEIVMLIIYLCAISMLVKVLFFHMDFYDCILEWGILVGTPVYQWIRTRMLKVALTVGPFGGKYMAKRFLRCLIVLIFVFGSIALIQPEELTWELAVSVLIPFGALFILLHFILAKWETKRAEKLGDEYDD